MRAGTRYTPIFFRCLIGSTTATDVFVCEECFKKMSNGEEVLGMIGDELIVKGVGDANSILNVVQSPLDLKCSGCGTSLNEVGKTGRFGCEKCYEVFSDLAAVADAQIDEKEKKLKEVLGDKAKESVKVGKEKVMEGRMRHAIKMEDYETAARVRDEIAKLKREKSDDAKAPE